MNNREKGSGGVKVGIVTSWLVFVVGAILELGVLTVSENLNEVGVVLMIVGTLGFILSLLFWDSWGGFKGSRQQRIAIWKDSDSQSREG